MMIKCSICDRRFSCGNICFSCGKAYCEFEAISKCPFCQSNLRDAEIREEKIDDSVIDWLTAGSLKIGLVDFEEIPPFLLPLLHTLTFENNESFEIVVFPSKESSWKIYNSFRKQANLNNLDYHKSLEKSRYTIIFDSTKDKRYILLNLGATSPDTVAFIIKFLSSVFSRLDILKDVNNKIVINALGEVLFDYVKKLGIPFIAVDDDTKYEILSIVEDLLRVYCEYESIKILIKDHLKDVSQFLNEKIEAIFSIIEENKLDTLANLFNVVSAYLNFASILALAKENQYLERYIEVRLYSKHKETKKRLEFFPDVIECLDCIIVELSQKEVYVSYELYLENVSRTLKHIIQILRPRYLRISEADALFKYCQMYEDTIIIGEMPDLELGSLEDFCNLLDAVFKREDLFPEGRILAGQALQGILIRKILYDNDYFSYLRGLKNVQGIAKLIVDSIPSIKERLGNLDLGYHDACLALMSFSQCSYFMKDYASAMMLINRSKSLAETYNVLAMQVMLNWKDFVETQDYEKLLKIYKIFSAIDFSEHVYLEKPVKTTGHLAGAIFNIKDRDAEFDKAEECALAISDETQDAPIFTLTSYLDQDHAVRNSLAFYHLVRLFRHISKALERDLEKNLKRALHESRAMSDNIAETDPLNSFTLKTEILYSVTSKNLERTRTACRKLRKEFPSAPALENFVEKVDNWLYDSEKLKGRRFLLSLQFDIPQYDPWETLFKKLVFAEMNQDLENHISGADALTFVEGVTDTKILENFARTCIPSKKIRFIDAEGFTKMNYYSESRIAKSFLGVSLFVVFDGDTSKIKKKQQIKDVLVKQITLSEGHILTLNENSIEDYLLVPAAIKRAFPSVSKSEEDIKSFFEKTKPKRDKKKVLDILFKDLGLGKYDDEKAELIASQMRKSEIDEEIRGKLEFIAAN